MSEAFASLRSPYRTLDPMSALEEPTSILLGVSQSAAKALDDVGLSTVFDLASSTVFANAVDICLLAESGQGRFAATGKVPHDVLRAHHDKPLAEFPLEPISILSSDSPPTELDALAAATDSASIRDLAAWPPYRTARELLDRVYNPLVMNGVLDQESPSDLVPSNGQYPTERVQYEVLLFDRFVGGRTVVTGSTDRSTALTSFATHTEALPTPRILGSDGPLDISELLADAEGYDRPAIGGVLTFTQSWYTKGLSLGNLIHGIALAPGESTKIAMIDWSRRARTSATEDIGENELLVSDLTRTRAISEITHAVATESQNGSSGATNFANSTQTGESKGTAGLLSDPLKLPGVETSGSSSGTSTGFSLGRAWSTSSGERDIDATLTQDIVDRTQQASHSARNRRASIVREVSQQESESISTRTLTNYNHMHALTVEYYEVVQLYRTVVELSKADRCLFVPLKPIDFRTLSLIDRYRAILAAAALSPAVREALDYPTGTTRVTAPAVTKPGVARKAATATTAKPATTSTTAKPATTSTTPTWEWWYGILLQKTVTLFNPPELGMSMVLASVAAYPGGGATWDAWSHALASVLTTKEAEDFVERGRVNVGSVPPQPPAGPAVPPQPPPTDTSASSPLDDLSKDSWNSKDVREAQVATGGVTRVLPDGRLVIPSDAVLHEIDFVASDSAVKPGTLTIRTVDGTIANIAWSQSGWVMTNNRIPIADLAALAMTASGVTGSDEIGFVSILFTFKTTSFRIVVPVKLEESAVLQVLYGATVPADVVGHLQDNRLYYSQVIWRSLDPATIGMMLSGYTWNVGGTDRPLIELVDPTPVAIAANYLVLRMSGDDAKERAEWLDKKKITIGGGREDLVPVPSGGVFAEAVLGRFNSAEKLDISRFWNWQDSPLPVNAPDIAAIQAGSRGEPDSTVPGSLGAPVLNIVNAPALPEPQGMGAILAAVQNGNMFRDMSGLAGTIGLAQAGLAGAQQGATAAGAQAGQNAAVAAQLGAKVAELAAKIVAAYFTGGASLAAGAGAEGLAGLAGGISGQGAKINQGKDMDSRGVERPTDGGDSDGGSAEGASISPDGAAGTWEGDATNAALGIEGGGGGFPSIVRRIVEQGVLGAVDAGTTGKTDELTYWPRQTSARIVQINPPGLFPFMNFTFTPTAPDGTKGGIKGPSGHDGEYTLKANGPGNFEMAVNIGTKPLYKNDLNVTLKIEGRHATVTGTYNEGTSDERKTPAGGDNTTATVTKDGKFLVSFTDAALRWY